MSHQSREDRRLSAGLLTTIFTLATLISAIVSLALGSEHIALSSVIDVVTSRIQGRPGSDPTMDVIVWDLRAPRAVLAVIVGAGLSLAGSGMQTLVRNPLADPYLLGVSSGASVGATAVLTFGILSGFGFYSLTLGALIGAIAASVLVYFVATSQGGLTPLRLVLSGVVLSAACSAVASFLVFMSEDSRSAQSVLFWMLGSVTGAGWDRLLLPGIVTVICGTVMLLFAAWLDAMAAGSDVAKSLGIPDTAVRQVLFIGLALLVGALVAASGGIGFVGLVVPHMARLLVGSSHRMMLPVAASLGALFLLWVDVAARLIAAPQEMPLGVITGLFGAPLFIILMGRSNYRFAEAS